MTGERVEITEAEDPRPEVELTVHRFGPVRRHDGVTIEDDEGEQGDADETT